jgi:hypothetical protein
VFEVVAVVAAAAGVIAGSVVLRHAETGRWLGRAWAVAGAALLILLTLFAALE